MKLCARHAANLTEALKHKGLWKFVDTTPAVAQLRTRKWIDGIAAPCEVDPLIISVLEINNKAMQLVGDHIYLPKANGEHHCPLCEVHKALQREADVEWIDNCTDAVLSLCLQNGLQPAKIAVTVH